MVVVIDGKTSKLQACDREAFELQKCLFKEDYDFCACEPYTKALQKCCHQYKVCPEAAESPLAFLRHTAIIDDMMSAHGYPLTDRPSSPLAC